MKLSTTLSIIAIIIISGIVILGLLQFSGLSNKNEKTIDVTGISSISKPADRFILSIGAETKAETSKQAEEDNKAITEKIYAALKSLGLDEKDYSTEAYNIWPNYDYSEDGSGNITGYTVSHRISIDTAKISLASLVLDSAVKAGANSIYGLQFTLTEDTRNTAKIEAMKEATTNGKSKANAIADGLGVKITNIQKVSDSSIDYLPYYRTVTLAEVDSKGSGISIESGDVTVNAQISISYGFK